MSSKIEQDEEDEPNRANRLEFWTTLLPLVAFGGAGAYLCAGSIRDYFDVNTSMAAGSSLWIGLMVLLMALPFGYRMVDVLFMRAQDMNVHGGLIGIYMLATAGCYYLGGLGLKLFPLVVIAFVAVYGFVPGTAGDNDFGPQPGGRKPLKPRELSD